MGFGVIQPAQTDRERKLVRMPRDSRETSKIGSNRAANLLIIRKNVPEHQHPKSAGGGWSRRVKQIRVFGGEN
jgi:hypothetical protein